MDVLLNCLALNFCLYLWGGSFPWHSINSSLFCRALRAQNIHRLDPNASCRWATMILITSPYDPLCNLHHYVSSCYHSTAALLIGCACHDLLSASLSDNVQLAVISSNSLRGDSQKSESEGPTIIYLHLFCLLSLRSSVEILKSSNSTTVTGSSLTAPLLLTTVMCSAGRSCCHSENR